MTLLPEALTWQGITIGGADSDVYIAEGIEGFGQPALNMPSTQRQAGGTWGGLWTPQDAAYTVNAWLDAGHANARDWSGYKALRSSMRNRPMPSDELPLAWADLLGDGEMCAFVRPSRFVPIADETGTHNGAPGIDIQWVASDPTIYDYTQAARIWSSGDPVSGDEFEVANDGDLVPWARYAWELRMTAHGTVTDPFVKVEHDDGTFEQITWLGLSLSGGQVLTLGPDLVSRVGRVHVSGRIRSLTEKGFTSRAPRWWLLHPSDGEDGANVVTVGCGSGTFSGYLKTRGTR